jgi:hypothetical protein
MTMPVTTKDNRLNGQPYTKASLHTGFPGSTGANEVSGGGYAQQNITVNVSSGGIRTMAAAANFSVPISLIRFLGYWDGATFADYVPNGGFTPKNYSCIPSTNTIVSTAHGYADDQKIVFIKGTPPGGLTEGTTYYVRNKTTDTFNVGATAGGAAIALSTAPSFGCQVCAITEDNYGAPGTHTIATASWSEPD